MARQPVIALLRGVNIGGHHKLPMSQLRALCEGLGLTSVQTYIQSGNVVFRAPSARNLENRLETAIEAAVGFRPAVILRTLDEMRAVAAANPFPPGFEPSKLAIFFSRTAPPGPLPLIESPTGETLHLAGRELFVYFPEGQGRSKLPFAKLERVFSGGPSTARNWNTLLKLIEIAESL
ncbi:MAG: DUF1697 domain-containing protein [Bryobacteraceae bacterium]|nr:DUF1697 domain-containing protein [Bryobacteraceae bacterium]